MTEKNISAPQRSAGIMSVGIALLIGLAVLGLCIYSGLKSISQGERVVTVRGLAEQEVKADRVIAPIRYKTTGANLQDGPGHYDGLARNHRPAHGPLYALSGQPALQRDPRDHRYVKSG